MANIKLEDFMVTTKKLETVRKAQEEKLKNVFLSFVFRQISIYNEKLGERNFDLNFNPCSGNFFFGAFFDFCSSYNTFFPKALCDDYKDNDCAKFKDIILSNQKMFEDRGFVLTLLRYKEDEIPIYGIKFSW